MRDLRFEATYRGHTTRRRPTNALRKLQWAGHQLACVWSSDVLCRLFIA